MVCWRLGRCLTKSVNWPSGETVPTYSSLIAYPTQLRLSAEPWVSQVLDDSVIQMRRYRTGIFQFISFSVAVPPLPSVIVPMEKSARCPLLMPS